MNENSIKAGSLLILVKFIRNPTGKANEGTGMFKVGTFSNDVMVDINVMFGSIGFAS